MKASELAISHAMKHSYVTVSATGLYRQIVSFVLLRSGLGRPADIPVSREATGKSFIVLLFIDNGVLLVV